MGDGRIFLKISCLFHDDLSMSLMSAGSIWLDSTFKKQKKTSSASDEEPLHCRRPELEEKLKEDFLAHERLYTYISSLLLVIIQF
jgi:hypothetical protein